MNSTHHRARLEQIARVAMLEREMLPDFSADVLAEVEALRPLPHQPEDGRRDLRDRPWSSIDNDDSRDLDQLTVAEALPDGRTRLLVAVADVDALVRQGLSVDEHARNNTTSVYTAACIFPMLPERLSTDLTSLNEHEDRAAIVIEMVFDSDASLESSAIHVAMVHNRAQLAYNSVGAWLVGEGPMPAGIASVEGLEKNLRLQDCTAQAIRRLRYEHGALELQTIQTRSVFDGDELVGLEVDEGNRAKELIEDFMIAANGVTARFLHSRGLPSLRRVVRSPSRWERIVDLAAALEYRLPPRADSKALNAFLAARREVDPLRFPDLSLAVVKLIGSGEYTVEYPGDAPTGHFGLAVRNYAHSTAPNRRFPDLITQRLIKQALAGEPAAYDARELEILARHCTRKEDDADKVERRLRKSAAALLLEPSIGMHFDALVTGASHKGSWVRLLEPHVEGKLTEGDSGIDVGDYLRVELVDTDVERGYIDFRRVAD